MSILFFQTQQLPLPHGHNQLQQALGLQPVHHHQRGGWGRTANGSVKQLWEQCWCRTTITPSKFTECSEIWEKSEWMQGSMNEWMQYACLFYISIYDMCVSIYSPQVHIVGSWYILWIIQRCSSDFPHISIYSPVSNLLVLWDLLSNTTNDCLVNL